MSEVKDMREAYEKLKADFPPEAYQIDRTRGIPLSSLKAQYIVERLNEVFGLGNWSLTGVYQETKSGVLYFGKLTAAVGDKVATVESPGFGYWRENDNDGDSYKSAKTESLSKCASYLGVGNDMYKGKVILNQDATKDLEKFSDAKEGEFIFEEDESEAPKEPPKNPSGPKLRSDRTLNKGSRFSPKAKTVNE